MFKRISTCNWPLSLSHVLMLNHHSDGNHNVEGFMMQDVSVLGLHLWLVYVPCALVVTTAAVSKETDPWSLDYFDLGLFGSLCTCFETGFFHFCVHHQHVAITETRQHFTVIMHALYLLDDLLGCNDHTLSFESFARTWLQQSSRQTILIQRQLMLWISHFLCSGFMLKMYCNDQSLEFKLGFLNFLLTLQTQAAGP